MAFQAYRAVPFEHTHENQFFNYLCDVFASVWGQRDEKLYLIGNVFVDGVPFDAILLRPNAMMVLDFKDYGGRISFSQNYKWKADGVEVKGGHQANPFIQIRNNKYAFMNFLKENVSFHSAPNLGHISGICVFQQAIRFDHNSLPDNIRRWFFITDLEKVVRQVDEIMSPAIQLLDSEMDAIVNALDVPAYHPVKVESVLQPTRICEVEKKSSAERSTEKNVLIQKKARGCAISVEGRAPTKEKLEDYYQGVTLTADQTQTIEKLATFLRTNEFGVFIMRGYAGTGKTFIVKGIVDYLTKKGIAVRLMAPTGKAAKVISEKTATDAGTMHRYIYNVDVSDEDAHYEVIGTLRKNVDPVNTVYIVDESSMVSNERTENESFSFGSGCLLNDLFTYVRDSEEPQQRKIIFIGDNAQLPPVHMHMSPALSSSYLHRHFQIQPNEVEMTEVVRQKLGSGVMDNATKLRSAIAQSRFNQLDIDTTKPDVKELMPRQMVPRYMEICQKSVSKTKDVILVALSNAMVNSYNRQCRRYFFPGVEDVCVGDKLIVLTNMSRIDISVTNGDFALVQEVLSEPEVRLVSLKRKEGSEKVALIFRDVKLILRDMQGVCKKITCKILENLLYRDRPTLTPRESKAIFIDFLHRNPHLKSGTKEFKEAWRRDPYATALRVKFGYAITCHKAQGSEWKHVLVNCANCQINPLTSNYFRWLYTAITRTSQNVYLCNVPRMHLGSLMKVAGDASWFRKTERVAWEEPLSEERNRVELPSATKPTRTDVHIRKAPTIHSVSKQTTKKDMHVVLRRMVRRCIENQGFEIKEVVQYPYQDRFFIADSVRTVGIQIFYNGKNKITNISPLHRTSLSTRLQEILSPLKNQRIALRSAEKPVRYQASDPSLQELHVHLSTYCEQKGIQIIRVEPLQWMQRYTFQKGRGIAVIDFHYNGKMQFTSFDPLKQKCTSPALVQEILAVFRS